ncbi:MAG: NADP-dependent oxidoreductase [Plesiomonas shigelloides]
MASSQQAAEFTRGENIGLAITAFGAPEVLQVQTLPMPQAGAQQVVVQVAVAGINPIDAKTRAGLGWAAQAHKDDLPWVPGFDVAGTVVHASSDSAWQCGDRVAGYVQGGGGYSRYLAVPDALLARVPDNVSLAQAGALPVAGITAWQMVRKMAVQPGERVLVSAPAGGVGHVLVQLLRRSGAQVVALCSAQKSTLAQQLGAHEIIDYHQPLPTAADIVPRQVDVLFDLVGGDAGIRALPWVKPSGRVLTLPTISAERVCQAAAERGISTAVGLLAQPNVHDLQALLALIAQGELHIMLSKEYPLQDGAEAHRELERGRTCGKLIFSLEEPCTTATKA